MGIFDNLAQVEKETLLNNIRVDVALAASTATVAAGALPVSGGTIVAPTSSQNALVLSAPVGNASVAPLQIIASTASQVFIDFIGAAFSMASINLASNKTVATILVHYTGAGGISGFGYIPIFLGVI